jgi:two-component system, NtrC family, sensor kinase
MTEQDGLFDSVEKDAALLMDERLVQAHKLAALGELSAGLAHEINNPLAVIRQEAELLQELLPAAVLVNLPDGQDVQDSLGEIIRQVDRCKSITHNLLNYARKNDPVIQAMDVNAIVDDMVRLMEKEAMHRNISIIKDYQPDLPAVPVDAPQLRQVVLNLLNNAVQSISNKGEVRVKTLQSGPDSVEIRIQDTGCGIAPEYLDKIFDPFFTTKSPGQGTGLGLSISQKIVSRLGGTITVKSRLGQGSVFIVTLPTQESKDASCLKS